MTTKEFATLVNLLLPDFPDFASKRRLLFKVPVKHILRGINFEPSAFDKKSFSATVFVMPLFVPSEHLTLNFGDRVRNKGNGDRWSIDMPDLSAELSKAMKRKAVPFLASVESLQDFIEIAQRSLSEVTGSRTYNNPHTLQAIAYAFVCTGEFQQACDALARLLKQLDLKVSWQQAMAERAEAMVAELRDNPSAAQHRLEIWEAETVKNLDLESFVGKLRNLPYI
jgi:hypothetical protein